ncbi:MAG: phenylalanine--tRNA ligase subunit beta [Candidatus Nanohaloarchaea archaeon]
MAHIKINKREFDELVGQKIEEQRLDEEASFLGVHWNHVEGEKWDVEVYPNRPDLLSVEGLARAYRGFFGVDTGIEGYNVKRGDISVDIHESVDEVRPVIAGAVVRNLELSDRMINGLIQMQEKLHETIGRRREKLAIGLHDLSVLEPPFTYRAVEPEKVSFKPLEYDSHMQLGEILSEHEKGIKYSWILEDNDRYPIIEDSEGKVLSFPPIINNQLTEVDTGTSEIFIDVTGNDRKSVVKALNILVTALEERGGVIESVELDGEKMPELSPGEWKIDPEYANRISGLELSRSEMMDRLKQMKFGAEAGDEIKVEVPAYRTDIMHQYDLIEDIVIAHRYDNIQPELPEVDQTAEENQLSDFSNILRDVLQGTGALETNTYILSNKEKLFKRMNVEEKEVAEMSNALTEDYTVVRNWLLPSMMNVLKRNKHRSYPQKFFEVDDVSIPSESSYTGVRNCRKLAYVESHGDADFTDAREVLQVLERDLGIQLEVRDVGKDCFRQGRQGEIRCRGERIGIIGELSGEVLEDWELEQPVSGFELNVYKLENYLKTEKKD